MLLDCKNPTESIIETAPDIKDNINAFLCTIQIIKFGSNIAKPSIQVLKYNIIKEII